MSDRCDMAAVDATLAMDLARIFKRNNKIVISTGSQAMSGNVQFLFQHRAVYIFCWRASRAQGQVKQKLSPRL